MFEASSKIDGGNIYYQSFFKLKGNELSDEIRSLQAKTTISLIKKFLNKRINKTYKQKGKSNFLRRRSPKDSELNINKSIKDQFNLLRVVDNERYPAFFLHKDTKYLIKIFKEVK